MLARAFFNRDSGTMRTLGEKDVERALVRAFQSKGHAITVSFVAGPDLEDAIRAAVSEKPDAIIVGGGDGTVSSSAALLADTGIALGIVPLGTMNLFARTLGLPLELDAAADALASGQRRDADLAMANGRPFIHQLSLGLQPRMVRLRERAGAYASKGGKILASARALGLVLRRPPSLDLVLVADGKERRLETPGIVVSNNPYGSGHLPYADRPATGLLGVYDVTSDRWGDLAQLAAEIVLGTWQGDANVEMTTAHQVTISAGPSQQSSAQATVDGELVRVEFPLAISKRPAALKVLAPDQS